MNFRIRGLLAALALLAGAASSVFAAPVPATVDLTALRCIQKSTLENGDDRVYALVNGVAAGKEFQTRLPEGGNTWPADKKKHPILEKNAINLWKGELNDGEFALVTISVFQGEGKDEALTKQYWDSIIAAEKAAPEFSKKTLTADEFKAFTGDTIKKQFAFGTLLKNQRAVISKIKTSFNRAKKTDHYSGLLNVIVWNDGTTIRKRIVPVGLTFGEHYGIDEKIYTKIKYTRNNVFVQDDKGDWSNDPLIPLSDDEKTVHVKMLENEIVKGKDGSPARKTTDYLADIQVTANGKALKWRLEGEETGVDEIHRYWHYAD